MQSANPATYNRAGTDTKRFVLGSHTIRRYVPTQRQYMALCRVI